LLIDKPAGPTSHDIVGWVRWALGERAVGHCGTLDPAATGLLVVCVGPATKLVEHLTAVDKRYLARFVLGRSTTTADAEGETIAETPIPAERLDELLTRANAALADLVGPLELAPPAFSAIKVDGKRAHALARAGEAPELPPRPMTVERLVVTGTGGGGSGDGDGDTGWLDADLTVSKGTYVRSLAQELGRRLGLPAHLGALRRLACGTLTLDDPLALTGLRANALPPIEGRPPRWRVELDPADRERTGAALLERMAAPWARLPFHVSELSGPDHLPALERFFQGQRLRADPQTCASLGLPDDPGEGLYAVVDPALGRMVIVRREPDQRGSERLAPDRVLRFEPRASDS